MNNTSQINHHDGRGFVGNLYIYRCPDRPGLLKIGSTKNSVSARVKQQSRETSASSEYQVVYERPVYVQAEAYLFLKHNDNPLRTFEEHILHASLASTRKQNSAKRGKPEWFEISLERAIYRLEGLLVGFESPYYLYLITAKTPGTGLHIANINCEFALRSDDDARVTAATKRFCAALARYCEKHTHYSFSEDERKTITTLSTSDNQVLAPLFTQSQLGAIVGEYHYQWNALSDIQRVAVALASRLAKGDEDTVARYSLLKTIEGIAHIHIAFPEWYAPIVSNLHTAISVSDTRYIELQSTIQAIKDINDGVTPWKLDAMTPGQPFEYRLTRNEDDTDGYDSMVYPFYINADNTSPRNPLYAPLWYESGRFLLDEHNLLDESCYDASDSSNGITDFDYDYECFYRGASDDWYKSVVHLVTKSAGDIYQHQGISNLLVAADLGYVPAIELLATMNLTVTEEARHTRAAKAYFTSLKH